MTKYIGRRVNVGLAKEAIRGTPVAASFWVPKSAVAYGDKTTKQKSKLNYGVIGGSNQAPKVLEWADGSIEGDVFDKSFGLLLLAAFGSDTVTGPSDSAYTHTFSISNNNQHQSLTLTLADPDQTDQYALAMLDSLEVDIVPGDVATFKANLVSRTGKKVAAASPSYIAENKFLGRHATIKVASLATGLGAATALSVKNLKLTIAKNAKQNNILGTVWPDDILNTYFEISGQITLDLDDQTFRQYMLDGSYKALRVDLLNSDALIGTSSRPQLTLDLSRVEFESWEPSRSGNDDIVTQSIQFSALYDITNGNIVNSCTLINAQSSY
ncbi:MAG TPA: phage tail tube protein [Patescibacteria group bacterium]|nr:phage tail tube protein [Patescibacteria group bacterium]